MKVSISICHFRGGNLELHERRQDIILQGNISRKQSITNLPFPLTTNDDDDKYDKFTWKTFI